MKIIGISAYIEVVKISPKFLDLMRYHRFFANIDE